MEGEDGCDGTKEKSEATMRSYRVFPLNFGLPSILSPQVCEEQTDTLSV